MAWSWPKPDGFAVLTAPMKALERHLNDAAKYWPIQEREITTDATVTTLYTLTVPVDTSVGVEGYVIARRTGGSAGAANDGAFYKVAFGAKNTSGTAALIGGAASVTTVAEDVAGWNVTVDASGGTIRVRVTGAANTNISWRWSGRSLSVKNEE